MTVRLIYISVSKRYRCSCRHVTRRVLLTRQDLLTLPEHLKSLPVFSGVRVVCSFQFYVERICHMCPLIFDFLFNGLVAFVSQPNRLINLHYLEIVSIYFHSKNWIQSMTTRRVKTGHLPNSRDQISGERTHFGKFMTRKKKR